MRALPELQPGSQKRENSSSLHWPTGRNIPVKGHFHASWDTGPPGHDANPDR